MKRFRFVLLGTGFMARLWMKEIKAREECEVAGIASRWDPSEELCRNFGIAPGTPFYRRWEEAVDRCEADAVIVTLPLAVHPEAVIRSLRAGRHVLCEKPLSIDSDGAKAVFEESRKHPASVVMVNQNFRWRPHIQTLRKAIGDGHIGRIGHIQYECRQQIRRKTVDAWREKMPDPYLLDFAIHHFDLLRYLTGDEPVRLMGMSFRPGWSWFAGSTAAAAIITWESGAVADYGGTMVSQGWETPQEGLITLIGENGTLRLDGESQTILQAKGEVRTLPREPLAGGELGYALAEFLEAVHEKRLPETHLAEHIRSLALSLAVIESARRGAAVELSEFTDFLE
ncbi:MAG: Gfo/Idh/MocA family oxidoreductase [Deltaproteobacteria bacterium]|nr:Gfo/Idh/MocA family oxidoreductase [Deltaproteobacteria bacterium]